MAGLVLVPQLDGGPQAGLNCTCAAGAMLVAHVTQGNKRPTGSEVRARCKENNGSPNVAGGTHPKQIAAAILEGWQARIAVVFNEGFETAWERGQTERWAVSFGIRYNPVAGGEFDAQPGFRKNHQVVLHKGLVYDPLADGRTPSTPKGPQAWPKALLRKAASALDLNGDAPGKPYAPIGDGLCYVMYAEPSGAPAAAATVTFKFGGTARLRGMYRVKQMDDGARIRSAPNASTAAVGAVPPGAILRTVAGGTTIPFRVEQTTEQGSNVGGSKRWHGDATGNQWVHSSLVELQP